MSIAWNELFICPHCNGLIEVSGISAPHPSEELWSDFSTQYYDNVGLASPVQKCETCGKYCFPKQSLGEIEDLRPLLKSVVVDVTDENLEMIAEVFSRQKDRSSILSALLSCYKYTKNPGDCLLPYDDMVKAAEQFKSENLRPNQRDNLCRLMVCGFNDKYQRGHECTCSPEDFKVFKHYAQQLIKRSKRRGDILLFADLHRQIRDFEKCIQILESPKEHFKEQVLDLQPQDFDFYAKQILEYARAGISHVFEYEKGPNWSPWNW